MTTSVLTSFTAYRQALTAAPGQCKTVVETFLRNIEKQGELNAFLRIYEEEVLVRAQEVASKLEQGQAGALAGLVVGLKDLFCYQEHPVGASSRILEAFIAQFNATAVQRLLEVDALLIGHQNCDEFGMGSSNENSAYGPVRNPLDTTRVAGGSSGGSAAAVKAQMCHVALGTDTGGSVRQPAAFCGLVGLKPTYGRIPRYGVVAYASSFDTVGIIAHNVADCAAVLEVVAGQDAYDNTSLPGPIPGYSNALQFAGAAKIAYFPETLDSEGLQPEISAHAAELIEALRLRGHRLEAVDFPWLPYALPTYYILSAAEASANLARYDGVRYGYRSPSAATVQEMYKRTRSEGFGLEVQRRILLGSFVLSASYHDAYYLQAQRVRRRIKETMEQILNQYDFILLPTTPTTAFPLGSKDGDPITQYLADLYTVLASIAGLPAISVPYGRDSNGLPIGMQLIGKALDEAQLLAFGNSIMGLPNA